MYYTTKTLFDKFYESNSLPKSTWDVLELEKLKMKYYKRHTIINQDQQLNDLRFINKLLDLIEFDNKINVAKAHIAEYQHKIANHIETLAQRPDEDCIDGIRVRRLKELIEEKKVQIKARSENIQNLQKKLKAKSQASLDVKKLLDLRENQVRISLDNIKAFLRAF
jgi:hypothetical protein